MEACSQLPVTSGLSPEQLARGDKRQRFALPWGFWGRPRTAVCQERALLGAVPAWPWHKRAINLGPASTLCASRPSARKAPTSLSYVCRSALGALWRSVMFPDALWELCAAFTLGLKEGSLHQGATGPCGAVVEGRPLLARAAGCPSWRVCGARRQPSRAARPRPAMEEHCRLPCSRRSRCGRGGTPPCRFQSGFSGMSAPQPRGMAAARLKRLLLAFSKAWREGGGSSEGDDSPVVVTPGVQPPLCTQGPEQVGTARPAARCAAGTCAAFLSHVGCVHASGLCCCRGALGGELRSRCPCRESWLGSA